MEKLQNQFKQQIKQIDDQYKFEVYIILIKDQKFKRVIG